jgi:hypothetical protein
MCLLERQMSETIAIPIGGRFGRIPTAEARCGLKRGALYALAAKNPGLFKKYGSATLVDLQKLDEILSELPAAQVSA